MKPRTEMGGGDPFEQRFERIRHVVFQLKRRVESYNEEAVRLFDLGHLEAIRLLMEKKQRDVRLIRHLQQFVKRWEARGEEEIGYDR
ncbi:hypothetical protein BSNK01_08710 [Bacillaceae bacterium]